MKKFNVIAIFDENMEKVLMCKRAKEPYAGLYNLIGGKIEKENDGLNEAYREMHEETGLDLEIVDCDPMFENTRYTSVGMSDESVSIVYGYAKGEASKDFLESSEDIELILADREEVKRILKDKEVSMNCAYHLMHFLVDEDPFSFLKK